MDPLATDEDVATQLGRDLTSAETDRVTGILAKASALFRYYAGQDFTEGETTVRLNVQGGRVRLAQTPANEVTEVLDGDGRDVDFILDGQWMKVTRGVEPLASHEFVRVTYTYGGEVPDLVRVTVAEVAAQVFRIAPQAAAGAVTQQRSAGSFQESNTYAAWAVGGGTKLSPEDRRVAESFKYQGTRVIVCQP